MKWAKVRANLQSVDSLSLHLSVDRGTLFRLSRTASRYYTRDEDVKSDGRKRIFFKPSGELKKVQLLIHKKILSFAPFHKSIHGYRKGRSPLTAAKPHIDKPILLKADIQDFFPSISPPAVYRAFRQLGISDQVARLLLKLCTHENQLPQGAPTSPAISNLIWQRPARRIQGFVDQHKFNSSVLGDDVFVSGTSRVGKFKNLVKRIIKEEGFQPNERKTVVLPCTDRQVVAGLVVNKKLNVKREYRRNVRQLLHNQGYNRREGVKVKKSSLAGRVAFVRHVNPSQGHKLQEKLERLD